jgi:hypothetical protein
MIMKRDSGKGVEKKEMRTEACGRRLKEMNR